MRVPDRATPPMFVRYSTASAVRNGPPESSGGLRKMHHWQGGYSARCREHDLNHDVFIPQLRRLLRPGQAGDRRVYDSLVADVLQSANPLDLFEASRQRSGVFLIEALYRTHLEQFESGDERVSSSLGALGYSRWVAWRRFREVIRSGSVGYGRGLDLYIRSSREAVADHVRDGWRPHDGHDDAEMSELLLGR